MFKRFNDGIGVSIVAIFVQSTTGSRGEGIQKVRTDSIWNNVEIVPGIRKLGSKDRIICTLFTQTRSVYV